MNTTVAELAIVVLLVVLLIVLGDRLMKYNERRNGKKNQIRPETMLQQAEWYFFLQGRFNAARDELHAQSLFNPAQIADQANEYITKYVHQFPTPDGYSDEEYEAYLSQQYVNGYFFEQQQVQLVREQRERRRQSSQEKQTTRRQAIVQKGVLQQEEEYSVQQWPLDKQFSQGHIPYNTQQLTAFQENVR